MLNRIVTLTPPGQEALFMCGIAGIFHPGGAPADRGALEAMAEVMLHRGPDGGGVWTDGAVGFSHRRLAVIDLDTGAQPMSTPDGRLTVVFNGEIYNFRRLRAQLEAWMKQQGDEGDKTEREAKQHQGRALRAAKAGKAGKAGKTN